MEGPPGSRYGAPQPLQRQRHPHLGRTLSLRRIEDSHSTDFRRKSQAESEVVPPDPARTRRRDRRTRKYVNVDQPFRRCRKRLRQSAR